MPIRGQMEHANLNIGKRETGLWVGKGSKKIKGRYDALLIGNGYCIEFVMVKQWLT